jgi:hypothetical protein
MAIAKFIKSCSKNDPGIRHEFFATEIANITSVTETSGEVTSAITMSGGTSFKRIQADLDSVQFKADAKFKTSGGYTQQLVARFSRPRKDLNILLESLREAVACGMAIIFVDNNAQPWIWGANAATKEGITRAINQMEVAADSGVLITDEDMQSVTITFTRLSGYPPTPFDTTIGNTILGGTAAFIAWS